MNKTPIKFGHEKMDAQIPRLQFTAAEKRDIAAVAASVAILMTQTVLKGDKVSGPQALRKVMESGMRTILEIERARKLGLLYETIGEVKDNASLDQSHPA